MNNANSIREHQLTTGAASRIHVVQMILYKAMERARSVQSIIMSTPAATSVPKTDAQEARVNTWVLTADVKPAIRALSMMMKHNNVLKSAAQCIPTKHPRGFVNKKLALLNKCRPLMAGASPATRDGNLMTKEQYARRSHARTTNTKILLEHALKRTAPVLSSHLIK